ncbi:PTS sorbitol transporter subunit IIA [Streptomyces oryzae]|uniref:PTS sorbitol transporter subunit IIA n=1 Tax=Streptomyces oryzae TaxID=1434886 RepID=A0ABS3X867_9ACTN|nr:PTS glucitol/sorbitol transporter subunit IIA [Streptomyces oryzae]MBO8191558.1 PTS sorbitol transporter subunit IIA [Streptomyces oryzae]
MNDSYYSSTILRVGDEAADLIQGGVLILFGEPLPRDLEGLSVVHRPADKPVLEMQPGDQVQLGAARLTLTAVGDLAHQNLATLGHLVIYVDPDPAAGLLPGAVHAKGQLDVPSPGAELRLARA